MKGLVTRAENIVKQTMNIDFGKWGGRLRNKQLRRLVEFAEAMELYLTRLGLRLEEYLDTPERDGTLNRFIACAAMHEDVKDKFLAFQDSLKWHLTLKSREQED